MDVLFILILDEHGGQQDQWQCRILYVFHFLSPIPNSLGMR